MQMSAVRITAKGGLAMNTVWLQMEPMVMTFATMLTKDPAILEEMVEGAMCQLWDFDMTRYNLMNPYHDGFIRLSLKNRVCDVWRKHNLKKEEK